MKFTTVFVTVAAVLAGVAALEAGPAPLEEREVADVSAREAFPEDLNPLVKRQCTASSCKCNKVQGQFCGNESINKNCKNGYVYECNRSTGNTCTYGPRTSCQKCGKLSC